MVFKLFVGDVQVSANNHLIGQIQRAFSTGHGPFRSQTVDHRTAMTGLLAAAGHQYQCQYDAQNGAVGGGWKGEMGRLEAW